MVHTQKHSLILPFFSSSRSSHASRGHSAYKWNVPTRRRLASKAASFIYVAGLLGVVAIWQYASNGSPAAQAANHAQQQNLQITHDSAAPASDNFSTNNAVPNSGASAGNSSDKSSTSDVQVKVNGQNIPVPKNGSTQQTVSTPSGSVNVNVSHSSTGSGQTTNTNVVSNSLNVSSSSSSVNTSDNTTLEEHSP